ncbi:uncharacterized protein LOC130922047 [Corythoichthys intestinalis]|uniref:uncharacterized protein LOC130922047 n=1 Tax=Corythoichthys intestinalis TaxID=161448 RepID=UPI0025A65FE9|nr:uncharacterized protein LOC130922047 [Corythoichthys intestinalis]
MPLHQLPGEILLQIFGYLSVADKHRVRATCIHLKEFVDCGLLWKDWTPVLNSFKRYNCDFWKLLRRRKISQVVMRSRTAKDWQLLAWYLPSLTTLVMDETSNEIFDSLKNFCQLKHLAVRGSCSYVSLNGFTLPQAERLTHLSICNVFFNTGSEHLISALAVFRNLKSLVCHSIDKNADLSKVIYSILCCFPQLKHLSWSCSPTKGAFRVPSPLPLENPHPLSSLELDEFHDSLSPDVMKLMPNLDSLVLRCNNDLCPDFFSKSLLIWLRGLHRLSSLAISSGPRVYIYADAIPSSVRTLTFCHEVISLLDIVSFARRLTNLVHLHVDTRSSYLDELPAHVPQLFPNLQIISIRGENVLEEDFLDLHNMADLKYVEMLDSWPELPELAAKFHELTDSRILIRTSQQIDNLDCQCYRNGLTFHRLTSKNIFE